MNVAELTLHLAEPDASALLELWRWRLPEGRKPLCLSLFGDWLLVDSEGCVSMLELTSGDIVPISNSPEEFSALAEVPEYSQKWLLAGLAERLIAAGMKLTPGQCYAFRTPPYLGGPLDPSNVVVWDLKLYQQGASELLQQVYGLRPGTEVISTPTSP